MGLKLRFIIFLINYNKFQLITTFKVLPCPLQNCQHQFTHQISRKKALHKFSSNVQQNWRDLSDGKNNDNQLHKLLQEDKSHMKKTNKDLLSQVKEIFYQVKEYQAVNGVEFVDKDTKSESVNFSDYEQEFNKEIKNFEEQIEANFESLPPSPRLEKNTFELLFGVTSE
jgi:predicted subunit of tRNA(5-methylaminomethyl-2-thiouridylate) methyltransferase